MAVGGGGARENKPEFKIPNRAAKEDSWRSGS